MRFVHTADWQIGRSFARFGETAARLRTARLDAIEAIGRLAVAEDAPHVLVAGDVFDSDTPSDLTLRGPIERMRGFPAVTWHLLPGNHDPHRPAGVWDRLVALSPPANVVLHLSDAALVFGEAAILPAPLLRKRETRDLTESMERVPTPDGAIRIGLAHGTVANFDPQGEASNPIDPARAERAGLAYLALGDWHRQLEINPRTWYAGTPEKERFDAQPEGRALLVTIDGPQAPPRVEPRRVGAFEWRAEALAFSELAQLADVEARLRREAQALSRLVLKLTITGAAPLAARRAIDQWVERLMAAVCHVECDDAGLHARPDAADLEAMDFDGVLRQAAERLQRRMADLALSDEERGLAEEALVAFYLKGTAEARREP